MNLPEKIEASPSIESPHGSAGLAWMQAALLALNLAWTTLCLGGFLAETMVVTSALAFGGFALLLARCALEKGGDAARLHPAGWYFAPFLAYALMNVFWVTPVRWLGWRDWLGWAQMIATFWIALDVARAPGPRRFVLATVAALGVVLVALASYQRFFDPHWLMLGRVQAEQFMGRASGAFGIPNSLAAFLLLLIPIALAAGWPGANQRAEAPARGRPSARGAAVLAGIFIFGLVLTVSRGAWISLGLALVIWPLLARGRAWRWRGRRAGLTLAVVLGAGLALYATLPGVRERFDLLARESGERTRPIMWRAAWQLWREAPALGTGAGSYNVLFERHRPEGYRDEPRWGHNDYLNTLSDYGAIGFALFFGAGAAVMWRVARSDKQPSCGIGVGLVAFALSLSIDFHLKLPALALVAASCAARWVGDAWPLRPKRHAPIWRWAGGLAALGMGFFLGAVARAHYQAETWRAEARASVDALAAKPLAPAGERAALGVAQATLQRASALDGGNAQAWADVAYVDSLLARHEPARTPALGREAEAAARRAIALTRVVPEFWWRLGVALDMQGRWVEAGAAFATATALAPRLALGWYYQAYHLSHQPLMRAQALSAVATCLRLDPDNRVAELLREQLASNR